MKLPPKKILIIAYACEPNETSEPGVGWYFSHEIAKFTDVTVLTRSNNREKIESFNESANITYRYFDLPSFWTRFKRKIPFGIQIYYGLWQLKVYRKLGKILEEENFDLVHHLTFANIRNVPPSYNLKVPFLWGPLGGGDPVPLSFLIKMNPRIIWSEFVNTILTLKSYISPWSYMTRKNSSAIVFRTESAQDRFPRNGCQNRFLICETATPHELPEVDTKCIEEDLKILCIGRMISIKAYIHALQGFKYFLDKGGKGSVTFLGTGPELKYLKNYVLKNNLENLVFFKGKIPNSEVLKELKDSHVLLHPSFREGGSWAIMEAMSYGLPVICLNRSGPRDMVTNECGILIDLKGKRELHKNIGDALLILMKDKDLYSRLSEQAKKRIAEHYTWDKRKEQMQEVYKSILKL